jgi:hypothetical protein
MNLIKKNIFVLTTVLSLVCIPYSCFCEGEDKDFDDYFNGLDNDAALDDAPITKAGTYDPYTIVLTLLDLNIISLLQEDLLLRSSPLNKRNILDQPMGALDRHYKFDDWILGGNIFYNEMNRCYFSQHCDNITCYLGITQENFLNKLDTTIKQITKLLDKLPFDPFDIIEILKNATVQERQAGILFFGEKQLPSWDISWKLPFYYLERNYWIDQAQQDKLAAEYGSATEDQTDYLQKHFLVADKIGFGDFRLTADTEAFDFNDNRFNFRVGGQVTIPTACALAYGIMGNRFRLHERKEDLDFADLTGYHLDELVNMILGDDPQIDKVVSIFKNLGICALDGLSAQLLEAPLGNSGHFGVGAYTKSRMPISVFIKRPWAEHFIYKGGMSLEYLFPRTEQRMFNKSTPLEEFDSRDFTSESQAYNNMIFLEQQIIDKFFPFVYPATVHPGIIFRWLGSLTYESRHWFFDIGTDTWVRSPEKLTCVRAPSDLVGELEINKAQRLMGYQWKVFGSLGYKIQRRAHTWFLSLAGDYAMDQSGIGSDYIASFNVEVDF